MQRRRPVTIVEKVTGRRRRAVLLGELWVGRGGESCGGHRLCAAGCQAPLVPLVPGRLREVDSPAELPRRPALT